MHIQDQMISYAGMGIENVTQALDEMPAGQEFKPSALQRTSQWNNLKGEYERGKLGWRIGQANCIEVVASGPETAYLRNGEPALILKERLRIVLSKEELLPGEDGMALERIRSLYPGNSNKIREISISAGIVNPVICRICPYLKKCTILKNERDKHR